MAAVRRPLIGVMGAGEGAAAAELQLAEALGRESPSAAGGCSVVDAPAA